jgi:hypothetical protein
MVTIGNIQLNTSEIISILAFIFSVIIGILNFLYTKKTFVASIYPQIQYELCIRLHEEPTLQELEGEYEFYLNLTNLSNNVTITDIHASISIKRLYKNFKIWQSYWLPFTYGQSHLVAPGSHTHIDTDGKIESLLLQKMPNIIKLIEVPHWRGEKRTLTYYSPLDSRPLKLRLTVRFTPGVTGAKYCYEKKEYDLIPNPRKYYDLPANHYDWQLKEK